MNELQTLSNQLSDLVASAAPSVVQVQRASGVVYAKDVVLTNARALGREDGLHVRTHDDRQLNAELHGWDPATGLALLRVADLNISPAVPSTEAARVGALAVAIARSWSNSLTASVGIISVIGGPLRTGRGRSIDEVIRTTAPMHEGFAGGAFVDMSGKVIGIATAAAIRGLGVIIPASIAWKTAADLLEHGRIRRGYLGVAGQPARLTDRQGLLIADVKDETPAARAGLLVGDVIVPIEQATASTSVVSVNWLGRRTPVNCTASGKVILAFAPDAVRRRLLSMPLEQATPRTITDVAELEAQLEAVREAGFARTYEELEVGLDAVAAPVRSAEGEIVAALDVSGPSHRLRVEGRHELVDLTKEAAADLSRRLGYRGRRT